MTFASGIGVWLPQKLSGITLMVDASTQPRATGQRSVLRLCWLFWRSPVCETLRRALRNASNVEPQESCIHPMLSHTAVARPVLLCSPVLSRQSNDYRTESGYKNGYKNGRVHVSLLRRVYTVTARRGYSGVVRPKNTINTEFRHYQLLA